MMKKKVCKLTKRGQYEVHDIKMKKLSVSSKKWCDRGGGRGYGWKTQKAYKIYLHSYENNLVPGHFKRKIRTFFRT